MFDLVKQQFVFLLEEYRFTVMGESSGEFGFGVTYRSVEILIRIESYHRELYAYAAPVFDPEKEASIFNILNYINRETTIEINPRYHHDIKSLPESYIKQAKFIACTMKDNMKKLEDFLSEKKFGERYNALSKYMERKYPELYKRC